jgi:DNA-directed RNA polymerase alpha subunit
MMDGIRIIQEGIWYIACAFDLPRISARGLSEEEAKFELREELEWSVARLKTEIEFIEDVQSRLGESSQRVPTERLELTRRIEWALINAGYTTIDSVRSLTDKQIVELEGVGWKSVPVIRNAIYKYDVRVKANS